MGESLINTKRRIVTIRSTEKITKAMKLVASVKYQRWKKYHEDNLPYATGMHELMVRTLRGIDFEEVEKPLLLRHFSAHKTLYVVVTSSLGLCGAYNYNLFKALDPVLKEGDELVLIGQKAYTHYHGKKYPTHENYLDLYSHFTYSAVRRMRHALVRQYKTGEFDSVVLVYTQYKNSMTFTPILYPLLPIDQKKEGLVENGFYGYPPLMEPDPEDLLNQILPHYIDSSLYAKLIESQLSELASRRNAMETATDAAEKISAQLQLEYNKARQNAITQEITEVIAGANAGKKEE